MTGGGQTLVVGIDLGATNYRVAIARGETILERETRPTPEAHTGTEVTQEIQETIENLLAAAGLEHEDVTGVGIGSVGPLDAESGVVIDPPNFPDSIEGIPLSGPIGDQLGAPVTVENDATAALIGERTEMDEPPANMAYLTISTGIGAGVAVDGRVLRGWGGNAAEVGHFRLDPESTLECGCGRPGHWEAFAGGNNVPEYARSLTDFFEGETALPLDSPEFDAADVFAAVGEDVLADIVVHRLERWNAQGLADLVHAYAPERVSIGGAVALENPELVVDPLRERLPDLVTTRVPEIRETPLGEDAVLLGGLELARRAADD